MSAYKEDRMSIEEENKHARRGCVIAFFLFPLLCYCCVLSPLANFTTVGQRASAHTVLYILSRGVPLPIPYARGLANTAIAGCQLDQANPQPADYQDQQDALSTEYEVMMHFYNQHYTILQNTDGMLTRYDPPNELPGNLSSAKLFYCPQ